MGNALKNLSLCKKWKKEFSIAFFTSIAFGLLVHIYKFTNNLPNHDSMYNFYHDQNLIGSGRWFLSVACGFSSYFDLPWINGLFSLVFIALTTVVLVSVFEMNNIFVICLTSGLMVSFPSVTEILCFGFTADGFFMAMFLSALSVFVVKQIKNTIGSVIVSTLLICFSCGIYQSYVSFAIVLFICFYLWILFTEEYSNKEYASFLVRFVVSLVIGLILYYIIWKMCMAIQGVSATDYQGIDHVGLLSPEGMIHAIKSVAKTWVAFLIEKNIFKHGVSLYAALNIVFFVAEIASFVVTIVKTKVYKSRFKVISVVICVVMIPFAVCMWQFVSPDVVYAYRMLHSILVLYVFGLLLFDRYVSSVFSTSFAVLTFVMIINLSICANIAYYYLNQEYENSYSEAVSLEYVLNKEIAETDGKYRIAIIGNREDDVALDQESEANHVFMFTSMIEKSLLMDSVHTENFLSNILYFDGEFADSETKAEIAATQEYQQMKPWFESYDVRIINDTITIKLG